MLLRLRWSWRDLRARWLQVAAIALIIGIGSGTYSGLTSVSSWRRTSYDASFDSLHMYDLRFELADGAFVDTDELLAAVDGIEHADAIDAVEPRLRVPTQLDASTSHETILVPGRLVGVDLGDGRPQVGGIHAFDGRPLDPGAIGRDVVLVDQHFAERHDLPATGELRLSGDQAVEYVGTALAPEDFFIIDDRGSILADFGVLYASLETVQRLSGHDGQVNDLVLTVEPGADRDVVEREVEAALHDAFPAVGFTLTRQEDDEVLRLLYDDIEGDQRYYDIFAILILAGAAFAAFNLTGRIVEAQRREIGIGMALGEPPSSIAVRPLLVGVQVALLGVGFGVLVGLLLDAAMADLLRSFNPLPVWRTAFQPDVFATGAALGVALPLIATAGPVWRAVRVAPVDAVRTMQRATSGGLAPLLRRVPLPGSSVAEMPFRNVLRAPRRTLLTALGIAAAITTLVAVVGMIDSFLATIDDGEEEIVGETPDRVTVGLDAFVPVDSPVVEDVRSAPVVDRVEPQLVLGGSLAPGGDDEIEVLLTLIDFDSEVWTPTAQEGELRPDEVGIVIADKAARDLGLQVGDTVTLRHPRREGLAGYRFVETELPVLAIHPNPYRFVSYMDLRAASIMDLEGIVNGLSVTPAHGATTEEVQRALFPQPGVASVESVSGAADALRDQIAEALGIFNVIQGAVLLLALLIAFNSTAISMDERARENATMFAFGLPVRRVLGVAVTESIVIGVIGTAIGLLAGRLLLEWLIRVLLPGTLPDLGVTAYLAPRTMVTAAALGIVAVALAPLLTLRRLRRMDIPSTLRVME